MSDRFFSLVLQKEPRHVDDAAVVERLRDLVAPIGLSVSLLKDGLDGGPAVLEIGGAKVSIVRQAQPVPDGTLERVARGSIGWPEAPAAVAVHTGHVIVGCLEEAQDHQQALHFAAMTTLATAAVLQESDGLGAVRQGGRLNSRRGVGRRHHQALRELQVGDVRHRELDAEELDVQGFPPLEDRDAVQQPPPDDDVAREAPAQEPRLQRPAAAHPPRGVGGHSPHPTAPPPHWPPGLQADDPGGRESQFWANFEQ